MPTNEIPIFTGLMIPADDLEDFGVELYGDHWRKPLAAALRQSERIFGSWVGTDGKPAPALALRLAYIARRQAIVLAHKSIRVQSRYLRLCKQMDIKPLIADEALAAAAKLLNPKQRGSAKRTDG